MTKYQGLHPEHIRQLQRAEARANEEEEERVAKVARIRNAETLEELKEAFLRYIGEW